MKHVAKICALMAIAMEALTLSACNTTTKAPVADAYLEDNEPISGMFFTTDSVVKVYENEGSYWLLYDDADANMFNVEICVDLETYELVTSTIENGQEMDGELVLNDDYSVEGAAVFTFMPEHGRSVKMECLSIK